MAAKDAEEKRLADTAGTATTPSPTEGGGAEPQGDRVEDADADDMAVDPDQVDDDALDQAIAEYHGAQQGTSQDARDAAKAAKRKVAGLFVPKAKVKKDLKKGQ